ncbi:MAG TPA: hypothetical protein VK855_12800 [Thioalkalivibrio sp.]|nr:hypothetical protein [Thioalkalivibrio sp.]
MIRRWYCWRCAITPNRYFAVGRIPGAVNVEGLLGTDGQKWRSLDDLAACRFIFCGCPFNP